MEMSGQAILVLFGACCFCMNIAQGQQSGDLQLVLNDGSTNAGNGRLEVFLNGRWGTVCEDDFGQEDGDVACRQLGYEGAIGYGRVRNFRYTVPSSSVPIWLDNLGCTGTEARLVSCNHPGVNVVNCAHSKDIGLVCHGNPTSSPTTGTLRLNTEGVTYPRTYSGRLEIYIGGQWGTVCDDSFGFTDARVACKQLGYMDYLFYGNVGSLGFTQSSNSTRIWLDDLGCSSSDTSLLNCRHRTVGMHNCVHSEDVALVCQGTGSVRLVAGSSTTSATRSSGRLEIYLYRKWGSVCVDFFNQPDADVACRQLGYARSDNYGTVASLGYSEASFRTRTWLDNLLCNEDDKTLLTCDHNGIAIENCDHSQDVAVSCTSTPLSGTNSITTTESTAGLRSGDIRLVTNSGLTGVNVGRLEIFYNGQWGTVCENGFGQEEGTVVCQHLGWEVAIGYGRVRNFGFNEAELSTPTWLDNLACTGSESRLDLCPHRGVGVEDCTHHQDVGVVCNGAPSRPALEGYLRLNSDGVTNPRTYSGRLEIYHTGEWGTVCDDRFGQTDADVACRQLGFKRAIFFGNVKSIGFTQASSNTRIWLDDVGCTTSDRSLINCNHRTFGFNDCSHSEDVALVCLGAGSLRLVAGSSTTSASQSSGRLEIYVNEEWGTICKDSFDQPDADVACRQLGYARADNYGTVGALGYSAASPFATTWYDDLLCTDSDTSILTCDSNGLRVENCVHSDDVAISCTSVPLTNTGAIVGAICGVILLILLVVLCFCVAGCVVVKRRRIKTQSVNARRRSDVGGGANAAVFSATATRIQIIDAGKQPQQPPPAHGQQVANQHDYKQNIMEAYPAQPYPGHENPGQYPTVGYPAYPAETGYPTYPTEAGVPPPYPVTP